LDYLGGGILARLEFPGSEFGHFYVETAFHTGKLKTTYQTLEFQPVVGQVTSFNFHSRYWGTLLGTGYIFNIAPNRAFEAYAKLFWTRIAGDTLKTNLNESLTLEPTNSLRLQVGLKYAHAVLPNISYFVGGAFEGEMKGTVKSHSYGRPITPISLKGGNAIVEAGLNLKPSANSPLSFGIASRGYFGRRKGIAGILHLSYSF
jgi:hypothetical protein